MKRVFGRKWQKVTGDFRGFHKGGHPNLHSAHSVTGMRLTLKAVYMEDREIQTKFLSGNRKEKEITWTIWL